MTWKIRGDPEGSSLSASETMTDASGLAATTLTFGSKSRGRVIEASVAGARGSPVFFAASALAGRPVAVVMATGAGGHAGWAGDGQVGVRNALLRRSYAVRPTDGYGNTVLSGVAIDWAVVTGGGTVAGAAQYSDGVSLARHTLGVVYGPQTVTATARAVPGAPRVTFTAVAVDALVDVGTTDVGDCHEGFKPQDITVPRGSTVGWGWLLCDADGDSNGADHNVTFEDDPTEPVSSPVKNYGHHVRSFALPGTYRYRCTLHSTSFAEGEVGRVLVQP